MFERCGPGPPPRRRAPPPERAGLPERPGYGRSPFAGAGTAARRETSVSSYLPILDERPSERLPPSFHRSQKPEKAAPRFAERRIFRKFIRDQNEKTCNPSGCRFLYFCENGPGVTAKAAAIDQHGRDMPPAPSRRVPHITGLFPPKKGRPASPPPVQKIF